MHCIVIAHNIRSTYNAGAILRSCDGFGVEAFYATGYTPYPALQDDSRPPHVRQKLTTQIAKTALGAEQTVAIAYEDDVTRLLERYRSQGYTIVALEQSVHSISLADYVPPERIALLLGEEVHGIPAPLLRSCDVTLEIPMHGLKESFNVSVATGIALYALTTQTKN